MFNTILYSIPLNPAYSGGIYDGTLQQYMIFTSYVSTNTVSTAYGGICGGILTRFNRKMEA